MTYVPSPAGTLLVPSGPNGMHLFVIMTNPCPRGSYLMFSVSTIRIGKYHDPTCTFVGGEHEFITAPSYVVYSHPEQRFAVGLQKCVIGGLFVPRPNLDAEHFERICEGVANSARCPPWAVSHFTKYR